MIFEKMYINGELFRTLYTYDDANVSSLASDLTLEATTDEIHGLNRELVGSGTAIIGHSPLNATYGYDEPEISFYQVGSKFSETIDLTSIGLPTHTQKPIYSCKLGTTTKTVSFKYFFEETPAGYGLLPNADVDFCGVLLNDTKTGLSTQERLDIYFVNYSEADIIQYCTDNSLPNPIPVGGFDTNGMIGITYNTTTKQPTKIKFYVFE